MNIIGAGDLTFRNDSLFMAAIDQQIVLVDIGTPSNSISIFTYSTGSWIYGISTFFISCDSLISYASSIDGQVYVIDFTGQNLEPINCNDFIYANGLATPNEWQTTDCVFTLDLDGDDSSGSINGSFGYVTCVLPGPVVDTDLVIQSGYLIDSVVIDSAFHPAIQTGDLPFEYLTASITPNINVLGNGTARLVLVNQGTATDEDFRAALLTVLYHNDAAQPSYGDTKDFQVTVWSQASGQQLEAWFSITYWPHPVFSFGNDTTLCSGEVLLLAPPTPPIGAGPAYTITWQDGSTTDTYQIGGPGTFYATYEIDPVYMGCIWSDTIVVSAGQTISTQSSIQLCNGDNFTLNGQTITSDTTICTTSPAFSGCDSTHCTTVIFMPLVQSTVAASICQGSSFPFNGQMLTVAGTYLDTLGNPSGCDTVLELILSVLPTSITMLDSTVCQGGSVTVGGQFFSSPGLHTVMLPAANGCDSTVMLTLSVLQNTSANVSATICEGSSVSIGDSTFTAPGNYQVTLPNWLGCDSTVNLSLTVQSAISINLDTAICKGQTLVFFGQALTQPGNYEHTATSPSTCDTVYNLTLSVLALPTVAISQSPNGCAASAVLLSASSSTAANGFCGQMQQRGQQFRPLPAANIW